MTLNARLARLEQKHHPGDPYEHMSIEGIVAVLVDLDQTIEASVGMPINEYADKIEEQIRTGSLQDMDETLARGFINSVRLPNPEIARELHRAKSPYPSFLRSVLSPPSPEAAS